MEKTMGVVTALTLQEAAERARVAAQRTGIPWPANGQAEGVGGMRLDLTGRPAQEEVAWATLDKNTGVLGLFASGQFLGAANRNLGQILQVQPLELPGLGHWALMVDDRYDERTGAFLLEERRRIYVWDGRGPRQVFVGTTRREEIINTRWQNPRGPALWRLYRTVGEIELQGGTLIHRTTQQRLEIPGLPDKDVPRADEFRLAAEEHQEERLRWNPRLRRFDPMENAV